MGMTIRELAETLKARPGMRIKITHTDLFDGAGSPIYTPALTDAQILAYGDWEIYFSFEEGNTVFCTVI